MGHYYRNLGEDITDKNLRGGLVAIDGALHVIESEIVAMSRAITERLAQREKNYAESGGRAAFTDSEIAAHAVEDVRLRTRQSELTNLRFAIGTARGRTEWLG